MASSGPIGPRPETAASISGATIPCWPVNDSTLRIISATSPVLGVGIRYACRRLPACMMKDSSSVQTRGIADQDRPDAFAGGRVPEASRPRRIGREQYATVATICRIEYPAGVRQGRAHWFPGRSVKEPQVVIFRGNGKTIRRPVGRNPTTLRCTGCWPSPHRLRRRES